MTVPVAPDGYKRLIGRLGIASSSQLRPTGQIDLDPSAEVESEILGIIGLLNPERVAQVHEDGKEVLGPHTLHEFTHTRQEPSSSDEEDVPSRSDIKAGVCFPSPPLSSTEVGIKRGRLNRARKHLSSNEPSAGKQEVEHMKLRPQITSQFRGTSILLGK